VFGRLELFWLNEPFERALGGRSDCAAALRLLLLPASELGRFPLLPAERAATTPLAVELSRPRRSGNRGAPVVFGGQHGAIVAGHLFVLGLHRSGRNVVIVLRCQFHRGGPRGDAAGAAVIADIVDGGAVDHGVVDIGVVNQGGVHMGDSGVVVEDSATPLATNKPYAAVAESIINSAVEADVSAPVTCMQA